MGWDGMRWDGDGWDGDGWRWAGMSGLGEQFVLEGVWLGVGGRRA